MKELNKILIIIPAYNEASHIGKVIAEVKEKCSFADILVVNDGSPDSTGDIAKKHGIKVINIPFRLGIGGAMQTGFIFAAQNDYDIVARLDGDGQHKPLEVNNLIQPILNKEVDVVIGSRFLEEKSYLSSPLRRLGIGFLSKLLFFLTGQKFTDATSGFRAANKKAINFYTRNYPVDYPEAEAIILLIRRNFKLKEIPITMRPRLSGKSSIRGFHTIYYMVKVILAICIAVLGRDGGKEERC